MIFTFNQYVKKMIMSTDIIPTTPLLKVEYDNICIICYDPLSQDVGIETTKCGHDYCVDCYNKLVKLDNKCAMCRTFLDYPINDFFTIGSECNYISRWRCCMHDVTILDGKVQQMDATSIYAMYIEYGLEPSSHFAEYKHVYDKYEYKYRLKIMAKKIEQGDLESLKPLLDGVSSPGLLSHAVKHNQFDILKYLVEEKEEKVVLEDLKNCCHYKDLDMFKYLERFYSHQEVDDNSLIITAAWRRNLELLKYLIDEKEYKISSRICLLCPCEQKLIDERDGKDTDNSDKVLNYMINKFIEQKIRLEGSDAITLEDFFPLVFDELFKNGLVDKFKVDIDVNFEYPDITVDDRLMFMLNYDIMTLKSSIKEYCINNRGYIKLPHFQRDIASMSVEFEYTDSTKCEEVKIDFNGGSPLVLPSSKPNKFETNFVSSLHIKCLGWNDILCHFKTATKNFKSIKINVKFDDAHAGGCMGMGNQHAINYQLTPDKCIMIKTGACCTKDVTETWEESFNK
jgi:hypothetical protein